MTHLSLNNFSAPVYERPISAEAERLIAKTEQMLAEHHERKIRECLAKTAHALGEMFDNLGDELPMERV